ncbi:hypothetical protein PAPYR_11237 [Paratrimastix pyriformis]|uniref:Uncharacterized protein n=1 Tax=Paratrimastix pyriformis TaxID=342808 RepID=A0ABQ8U8G6_9EUKA|nr:hypothetical protein PAPYR_11237 [Paratrimastix pyriformis]
MLGSSYQVSLLRLAPLRTDLRRSSSMALSRTSRPDLLRVISEATIKGAFLFSVLLSLLLKMSDQTSDPLGTPMNATASDTSESSEESHDHAMDASSAPALDASSAPTTDAKIPAPVTHVISTPAPSPPQFSGTTFEPPPCRFGGLSRILWTD